MRPLVWVSAKNTKSQCLTFCNLFHKHTVPFVFVTCQKRGGGALQYAYHMCLSYFLSTACLMMISKKSLSIRIKRSHVFGLGRCCSNLICSEINDTNLASPNRFALKDIILINFNCYSLLSHHAVILLPLASLRNSLPQHLVI